MLPKKKNIVGFVVVVVVALGVAFLALHGAAAHRDVQAFEEGLTGIDAITAFADYFTARLETPLAIEWTDNSGLWLLITLFALFIVVLQITSSKKKTIAGKEHGTARWGGIADIRDLFAETILKKELKKTKGNVKKEALREKYKNADAHLTATERISIFNYQLNNNILILGGSGAWKTRGFVMPNLLQAHSSFVITDPKGEILQKGGHFLREQGYKIRVLNLDNKAKSDGYNPFAYIHPEREGYEERVLSLIEAIIINTDGGEKRGASDPFWDKAERLFLQAIFFFVCDGLPPHERNMTSVLELISWLKIEDENDALDSDLDRFATDFARRQGGDHIGVEQYNEFRSKASGKTAKSIVISSVARLAPFRTSSVKKIFSHDTMELPYLGEEKMAIFVVVPPTDTTYNFIAGMLFTQMFQELQYCATEKYKHQGQRLPVPVRFLLDEFANTCTIPNFVKILAYARSFGIGIVPILQSLEQIKNMYKDEWGVIIDNCNVLLYLGSITHMETLEYMSKLLGKATFDKRTTGRTRGNKGSSSQNWDVIGRELLDPSEIRKLPRENCLLVVGGRNPFYSKKYEYTSHPNYKHTSDANPAFAYEHTPTAGRPTSVAAQPQSTASTKPNIYNGANQPETQAIEGMQEESSVRAALTFNRDETAHLVDEFSRQILEPQKESEVTINITPGVILEADDADVVMYDDEREEDLEVEVIGKELHVLIDKHQER